MNTQQTHNHNGKRWCYENRVHKTKLCNINVIEKEFKRKITMKIAHAPKNNKILKEKKNVSSYVEPFNLMLINKIWLKRAGKEKTRRETNERRKMEFEAFHSSHLTRSQLHQSIILDIIMLSFAFIHCITLNIFKAKIFSKIRLRSTVDVRRSTNIIANTKNTKIYFWSQANRNNFKTTRFPLGMTE